MNIDVELFDLIARYGIYKPDPSVQEIYMYEYFGYCLNQIMESIPEEKIIAIRGNGLHTEQMFKLMDEKQKKRITYLIDKDEGDIPENRSISLIYPEQIKDVDIDIILLSTFKWRNDFMMELMGFMPDIEVIDMYDEMEQCGIFFEKEFYTYPERIKKHINYTHTSITYKKYRCSEEGRKKFYLEKLIAYLVEIRDFSTAEKMILEYIGSGWDNENHYRSFLDELKALFDKIEGIIRKRNKSDIIINYVDCIGVDEFYETDFGKNRLQDSYCFMNAYTPTPWTHYTTSILLDGKLPIRDHTYKKTLYTDEETKLLRILKSNGYKFYYIAYPGMYERYFVNSSEIPRIPKGFGVLMPGTTGGRAGTECSTRMQWYSLRSCVESSENNVCCWIHNLVETHEPTYFSLKENLFYHPEQRQDGIKFIFFQIEWYKRFYSDQTTFIYLSDHGGRKWERSYVSESCHVPLVIRGRNIPSIIENRLYSHEFFHVLMKEIVNSRNKSFEGCFSKYIIHENVDFVNINKLKDFVGRFLRSRIPFPSKLAQCRAIRTEKDLYACYPNGVECYFILPDEETNLITDERYQTRIEELRKLCGKDFIDVKKESYKFTASEFLHNVIDLMPSDQIKW